jgi:PAS domain S-box-containing protein
MSRLELNHETKGSDVSQGYNISVRNLIPELRNALQDVVGINVMPRVVATVNHTIRDLIGSYDEKFEVYKNQLKILDEELRTRRQTEQRWRTAFENSAIGIFMADSAGRYVAANTAFLDMLGYTASELYRLSFLEATFEGDRKANLELINELLAGKRQHFEMEKRYCRKDGSLVWVRSNVALVPGISFIEPFWISIVEDITQRKLAEDNLRASERSLRELTETIPCSSTQDYRQKRCEALAGRRRFTRMMLKKWSRPGTPQFSPANYFRLNFAGFAQRKGHIAGASLALCRCATKGDA